MGQRIGGGMTYPLGTIYMASGKAANLCTITDTHTTHNVAGELVKTRYVASHVFLGQTVTESDIVDVTVARGIDRLTNHLTKGTK